MPNMVTQTQLVSPTNGTQSFALQDLEMGKFILNNGTTIVRTQLTTADGTSGVGTATPLPVQEQYAPGYEDNTNAVAGVLMKPVASSTYSPSDHTNFGAAAGTGVLIKNSAGNVYSAYVTSGTSAVRYFQLFNQATVPVVGQTPVASYPMGSVAAGGLYELKLDSSHFAPSKHFTTGIAAAISSTSGTLGTASITVTDYTWHIKYV